MNELALNREMSKHLIEIGFLSKKKTNYEYMPKCLSLLAPWIIVDIGAQCQPMSFFGYSFSLKAEDIKDNIENIPKYDPWLYLINDYTGMSAVVYYPKKTERKIGDVIDIIFIGLYVQYKFKWIDGTSGLFANQIVPLLNIEAESIPLQNIYCK